MSRLPLIALLVPLGAPVLAAELRITVQIPTIEVAEYHRPYVAIWIEKPDQSVVTDLRLVRRGTRRHGLARRSAAVVAAERT